ncbi:enoyl-CoA hydratase/isomerase family protein [Ottowia sp.]|jgi:enoyl-CoA hydratase/carnithine racemase|uniref:enoyl-CoA hydratase/isomerase family protein n=1 Tax=Ottowia sp. TaxID=1898956 RepID=UPI0025CF0C2D|nr:enoyl-CoA hydratase/isomerase family protein [Ottowia sp.]MBK6614335.1 enoyl-CoA hydratase/isomerase family protein [Ottowia sp.]
MNATAAPQDAVLVERLEGVIQLTLNAPKNRNSLQSPGIYEGLMAGFDALEQDSSLRAAVITGAGGAFCSGGDLRQLAAGSEDDVRTRMTRNAWLYRRIALSDKLIVAAVDGPAYGAGLGLAAACDVVVAGQSAVFCCAFARVGAMPDAALFWSLPARVGIPQARRLMLWAGEVKGSEAVSIGLADEYVAEGSALPLARQLARRIAQGPVRSFGRIKTGLRQAPMSMEQALGFQLDNAPGLFASDDFKEGAAAFFEKRAPRFGRGDE